MPDNKAYEKIANKLADIHEKFTEIEQIANVINIYTKENCYEMIPLVNILDTKINDASKIFES